MRRRIGEIFLMVFENSSIRADFLGENVLY